MSELPRPRDGNPEASKPEPVVSAGQNIPVEPERTDSSQARLGEVVSYLQTPAPDKQPDTKLPFVPLGDTDVRIPEDENKHSMPDRWVDEVDGGRVAGMHRLPEDPNPNVLFTTVVVEAADSRSEFDKVVTPKDEASLPHSLTVVRGILDYSATEGEEGKHPTFRIERDPLLPNLLPGTTEESLARGKVLHERREIKRAKEGAELDALYEAPAQEERNTLTPAELQQQRELAQAARQSELDAMAVEDNEHDGQNPEVLPEKAYIGGKMVGVEVLSLDSDDPEDRTLYTYLEAIAANTMPITQTPVQEKSLKYDVNLVTVSLVDGLNKATGETETRIAEHRVSLLEQQEITSTDNALAIGKELYVRRQAELGQLEAQYNAPVTDLLQLEGMPLVDKVAFVANLEGKEDDEAVKALKSSVIADVLQADDPGGVQIVGVWQRTAKDDYPLSPKVFPRDGRILVEPKSDYAIHVFGSNGEGHISGTRFAVAGHLALADQVDDTEKQYIVDVKISDIGEWQQESAAAYFNRQMLSPLLTETYESRDRYANPTDRQITFRRDGAIEDLLDAVAQAQGDHPTLGAFFTVDFDAQGQPSAFVMRPLTESNSVDRLLRPDEPAQVAVSDEIVTVGLGELAAKNERKLEALKPDEGWQPSEEARARFMELTLLDRLRFLDEQDSNTAVDWRALQGIAIRDASEMDLDDPERAGTAIIKSGHLGNYDAYDIHVVFPDKDGRQVTVRSDRSRMVDAYRLLHAEEPRELLLKRIDKQVDMVGDIQNEPAYAGYNRYLRGIQTSDKADTNVAIESKERYLEQYLRISNGIRSTYPDLARDLLQVEFDEQGEPVNVSLRGLEEDKHEAAARLLGDKAYQGKPPGVTLSPEAYTTDLEGLSPQIKVQVKAHWEQLSRQSTIQEASSPRSL